MVWGTVLGLTPCFFFLRAHQLALDRVGGIAKTMSGHSLGDGALTLARCRSCGLPQLGGGLFCGQAYSLRGIKGKLSVFFLFLKLCFTFTVAHFFA